MNWDSLRKEHTAPLACVYLNSPANGLLSIVNAEKTAEQVQLFLQNPDTYRMNFIFKTIPAIRLLTAELIGATANEVGLVPNFSIGLNLLLPSLNKKTVCLVKGDYPSLTMPFENSNYKIQWFQGNEDGSIGLDKLDAFLSQHPVDILAISHSQWLSGYTIVPEAISDICRKNKCLFLLDSTQSFGAIPIDVKSEGIDIMIGSCYKWPLAGFGNGIMYVEQSLLKSISPMIGGFNSMTFENGNITYQEGIRSFEPGHHDHEAFHRLNFALKRMKTIGQEQIHQRITSLLSTLMDSLNALGIEIIGNYPLDNRLGIVSIKSIKGLFQHLTQQGISCSERGGNIRMGVHYYNNQSDIDALTNTISLYLG